MRTPRAFLHAMRNRRADRIGPAEADQLVTGDDPGPPHAGLRHLLDAARAPATAQELRGEKAAVAAFAAHRKRAARAARRNRMSKVRTAVVPVAAALALLTFGGTALAARTGNLPQEAQQHAHRLFSALGVPAPRTGPVSPPTRPASTPSPAITALSWCDAWPGGSLSGENRRRLVAAAGREDLVPGYCDELRRSASATPAAPRRPATPSTPARAPVTPSGPPTGGPKTPGPSATASTTASATAPQPSPGAHGGSAPPVTLPGGP